MTPEQFRDQFDKDVAKHEVKILHNDGIYRHLSCGIPGSSDMRFGITTWPGYLAITGDMGDFVFARTNDMFEFFRCDRIRPNYWSEKCCSSSVFGGGIKRFSVDKFRRNVIEHAIDVEDVEAKEELPENVREDIQELLSADNEHECVAKMNGFSSDNIEFADFWECDCEEFTHRYLWCCHAIVWAIAKFDEMTAAQTTEAAQ